MSPTRDFRETVRERAQREPEFLEALLQEAVHCIVNNEVEVGREILCDCIHAGIGFGELARLTGKSQESLIHMVSDNGTVNADYLLGILAVIAEQENFDVDVRVASRHHSEQLVEA